MRYIYLVTEGPHDVELIGRLLKPHGFRRVQQFEKLEPFWRPLVPRDFPHQGDLLRRVPVPVFFMAGDCSVAVHVADGVSKLASRVEATLAILPLEPALDAVGILLDSDDEKDLVSRHSGLRSRLQGSLTLPDRPGRVSSSVPRTGVYILPDNVSPGTLEDLLLECASQTYPSLLQAADVLVRTAEDNAPELLPEDLEELRKPAGRKKATLASIAAILKPGKTIQTSIQDNRWLDGPTLELARIAALRRFLHELMALAH
ncbi:DUF3226 domain-containing protein [Archangium sp.]|uniref:DUF3226 domain-containing protein n=1 Tax=Archangium sp. TaxID=1872627 RepID=UPI00286BD60D|nr:DUF3226 domain-containing protein [Archangium sp.]